MTTKTRTLTPKTLFRGLARELELLAGTYANLRVDHPALAPYPTLASLLERLTSRPHDDAKSELVASLVAIRQSSPHRLWVAVLLRAFRPMLAKLWKKLFGADTQERLALLILAFQGALLRVDPRRDAVRIAMYVRQQTRRFAIASLTKEIDWTEVGFGEDADELPSDELEALARDDRNVRSHLRRGALLPHVRKAYPTLSPKEQVREYHRLRRRLKDTVATDRTESEGTR